MSKINQMIMSFIKRQETILWEAQEGAGEAHGPCVLWTLAQEHRVKEQPQEKKYDLCTVKVWTSWVQFRHTYTKSLDPLDHAATEISTSQMGKEQCKQLDKVSFWTSPKG